MVSRNLNIVSFHELKSRPHACLAIGKFDGVHRGHAFLLKKLVEKAHKQNAQAWVLTFDPYPGALFKKNSFFKLLETEANYYKIMGMGVDGIAVVSFDEQFAAISEENFCQMLHDTFKLDSIFVGNSFSFGNKASGNSISLKKFMHSYGVEVDITPVLTIEDCPISSQKLRECVLEGNVELFFKLAGYPLHHHGTVVKGFQRGRLLGFPTANLCQPHVPLEPGVYAGLGGWKEGELHRCVIHVGEIPSFDVKESKTEVHFPGMDVDLYGKTLQVYFFRRIRKIVRFDSRDTLIKAIESDLDALCGFPHESWLKVLYHENFCGHNIDENQASNVISGNVKGE